VATNDLIDRLAAEAGAMRGPAVGSRLRWAAAAGLTGAVIIVLSWLGVRPDLGQAIATPAFWLKVGYAAALTLAGYVALERLARPVGSGRRGLALALGALAVLGVMGGAELAMAAPADRLTLWLGRTWRHCPLNILALSGPMMVAGLFAVHSLAPTRLLLAGAATGLFAGGVAMTAYCLHCPETQPAFVATWYSLGAALTATAGAALGPLVLRWR
jgi:hypothetical protein